MTVTTRRRTELRTDLGNARRVVAMHGKDLRWTAAHHWLVWDGRRWRPDDTDAAVRFAKRAVRSIFDEAKREPDADERAELSRWAVKSQRAAAIRAALDLAHSEPEIVARAEDFDRDPWLLNVENGTLDLRTGALREHRRENLITKLAPVVYDAGAAAPTWRAFLERVQPDPEVRAYLRRRIGYCLTGVTSEQTFDVDHGGGANGKSTFTEAIKRVLGDYAKATPFSTFLVRRENAPTNDLAGLCGARLVIAKEPPEGARLNVALVKELTGEDTISARFHYKEFFEYVPTFKIALVANHRPQIRETSEAAWRRVHLVPWTVTIPSSERDRDLSNRLRDELPGILAWAVEGCLEWQREGLAPPEAVLAATEAYRVEEDALGRFIHEECAVGPAYRVQATGLLRAYTSWASENGEDPDVSSKELAAYLSSHGFSSRKSDGRKWWHGLGLGAPSETDREDREDREGFRRTSCNPPTREDFSANGPDRPYRPSPPDGTPSPVGSPVSRDACPACGRTSPWEGRHLENCRRCAPLCGCATCRPPP